MWELADKMTQNTDFSQFKNKDTAEKYIEKYDMAVSEEFQTLSLDEKYELFDIIRKKNGLQNDIILDYLVEYYKTKWEFIWDINENELVEVIKNISIYWKLVNKSSLCTAPTKNFPGHIYYNSNPPYYFYAYYASDVRTWGWDAYKCDIELWYESPGTKIWSTNYMWRLMLSSSTWFWWVLSTRYVSWNRMSVVIWWVRSVAFWQTRNSLYSNIVIW